MGKNEKKQWDVIVIGAGASGMMTAIIGSNEIPGTITLEATSKGLKKGSVTIKGK